MTELTVQEWFDEIDQGLEYRRIYGLEDAWSRLEAYFYNVSDAQNNPGPNIIMSNGDALMSALNVPEPYVTIQARRPDYVLGARVNESLDNMLIDDLGIVDEMEAATIATYLWGRGFLKIGYDSEYGYAQELDYGKFKRGQVAGFTYSQYDFKRKQRIEFGKASPGMPWIQYTAPHDVVVPWGVRDVEYAPWIAHRVVRHIDDVKADPKYGGKRDLEPYLSMQDFVDSYKATMRPFRVGRDLGGFSTLQSSKDVEYVELWEIHDRRTGNIVVLATDHDKFLRNEPDLCQIDGRLPFVGMSFVPRARHFWTTPDAYFLEQHQLELIDIAVQGQKHRRAGVLRALVKEGVLSETAMEKLCSADVGAVVEVNDLGQPLSDSLSVFNPQFDQGVLIASDFTRRNAREMVGLSSNQLGEFDRSTRRSATEASIVNQASNLRMDRRQAQIARAYKRIFSIINPLLWKYWQTPRAMEVLGPEGQSLWLQFKGPEVKGDYKYSVGFSTGTAETLAQRRQNALQLYAMLRQDPTINPVELSQYLNLSFNDPAFSRIFTGGSGSGQGNPVQLGQMGVGGYQAGQAAVPEGGGGQQASANVGGTIQAAGT